MGLSIDEHIGVMEDLKSTMSVCMPEPEKTEICASLSKAIDTMRKYQKIEQIINYPVYIQEDVLRYKMICEVVGKKNITHGTYEGENRGGN